MPKFFSRRSKHKVVIENVEYDTDRLADMLQEIDPHEAADVINQLSNDDIAEVLSRIEPEAEVRRLIRDPHSTDSSLGDA